MNRYQEIIGKINYGLFLAIVALLPFPQICLRYACVAWIVVWAMEGRWLKRPKSLKENKTAIPFILFGLWYAWRMLSWFWAPDHAAWAWQMERYLTFILIVPVGIWGLNSCYDWKMAGKVLVTSCIIAIPIYVAIMLSFYYHRNLIELFQWGAPWNFDVPNWYTFFAENISHLKHRLFLCSVELFGIVIASQVFKGKKWLSAVVILIMLSVIPLTGSRQAILTAAGLMAIGLLCELPKRFRLRYGVGILLLGIVLGGGLLKLHPRMQNFDITDITEMREINPEHDVRFNIWGAALQHPSDYLMQGLGAGQSPQYMLKRYQEMGCNFYFSEGYNSHNQYLEETIELGIFGMLFFLLAWLSIPFCAKGKGRPTAILLTTLFLLNMCTDCMFGRFCGIALWSVGILIVFLQSNAERKEQTTRDAQTH